MRRAALALLIGASALCAAPLRAQEGGRPPVGGVSSPVDAMIFYLARGPAGACGENCSEWIAAEGVVQWDTHKRLIAFLERLEKRKLPVILDVWEKSNFNVAVTLGRIIRDRGLDAIAGKTAVAQCAGKTEPQCFELKRGGVPLDAAVDAAVKCDFACVLMLAGGVRRTVPTAGEVVLSGMRIRNRLGLKVSDEHRTGLHSLFTDQFRLYLKQMGVSTEVADIVDRNSESSGSTTRLAPDDLVRLRIVTEPSP